MSEISRQFLMSMAILGAMSPIERASREIRVAMGTLAEIQATSEEEPSRAVASAFARIEEAEASLSIWWKSSEIARLNEHGQAVLSAEAFEVLERALEIAEVSGGAYDPTLTKNGYTRIVLDPQSRFVRLPSGMTLDLGAIAKGHAVDRALAELEGVATSALVDLGTSSIALFGDELLTFEVRDPAGGPPPATFRLAEGAIGSSSREQRGDHILDPRTGKSPVAVDGVTVVSSSALEADALSTAVFALGADAGLALVEQRGAEGLVLLGGSSGYVVMATPGFVERYALEVAEGVGMELSSATGRR